MTAYRLERVSDVDMVFDGELLAEASTQWPGAARWQVLRIYLTDSDMWVVERTGYSRVEGESTKNRAWLCPRLGDVLRACRSRNKDDPSRWYITDVAYEMLTAAAEIDPRLDEILVERV